MKRPLVTVAAGFVLGEVLALQYEQAAASDFLVRMVLVLGGALGTALSLGALTAGAKSLGLWYAPRTGGIWKVPWGIVEKMQGRGAGRRALLLFFVLLLGGGLLGYGRSVQVKTGLDRDEGRAAEFAGAKVKVTGTVGRVEHKADSAALVLENVTVEAGRKWAGIGRVMVYMDREVGEGSFAGEELRAGGGIFAGEGPEGGKAPLAGKAVPSLPEVGMEVEARGKLDIMEGPRNPGEFDFKGYYRSKGIVCRMFGEEVEAVGGESSPYYNGLNGFRLWCSGILDRICLAEDSPVFKAVLLGDTSWLEPQVRSLYQRSGISHLLAVSGQHLSIIGGGLYLALRKCGLKYGAAGTAAGILVVSFGIMTGSSGSAMRAVVMILCLWLSAGAGRSYDTLSALGLAALLLLYGQPYLLFQSGFQLSFGAVLAIGGLGSWMIRAWEIEKGWQKTLIISVCVQLVITPVVLYHYYLYPLYGILLNLLVIPLVSVLMYSGILGIALGSFSIQGGRLAVGAGHYILRYYERICTGAQELPGYSLVMGRPRWWQIAVYAVAVAGILWAGRRRMRGKGSRGMDESGPGLKGKRENGKEMGCSGKGGHGGGLLSRQARGIALGLCAYAISFLLLLPLPVKGLEAVCLDVGQGDGIVLETKDGVVLIDGGSSSEKGLGEKTVEPFLKSRGVGVVDYSIVSHGDGDHISGLIYLMEESRDITIKNLILPGPGKGQEVYRELEQRAAENGTTVSYMEPGDEIHLGELKLVCLYAGNPSGASGDDRNAHSLVICADYGNFHMLFTGDMGVEEERGLLAQAGAIQGGDGGGGPIGAVQAEHLAHTTVLKTAHHGSATSSSQVFLECISPKLSVISYGRGNSYGHPSPQVLERFENLGIPVRKTGEGGAVILGTDGERLGSRYFLEE